jgi:hypothetical protein
MFDVAAAIEPDPVNARQWQVRDADGAAIGSILRTSPAADTILGYQGPTETLIGVDRSGRVVGIRLAKSYDNPEYVDYVREDAYFLGLFSDMSLSELAALDVELAEIEGVSGATMTSMAVANGVVAAAGNAVRQATRTQTRAPRRIWLTRDTGTIIVVLAGLAVALTPLRGKKTVRTGFRLLVIVYLGLINGDMVSQALIAGWAQNGVPWQSATGLVVLTTAALLVPLTSGRNAYCTHLCPHGAAQQLLKNRLPRQVRLPRKLAMALRTLPVLLLVWCVAVATVPLPFSLVDIEPFDAWVFQVAGWATMTVAVVGLTASLVVPMAYCRYGCPTGSMLKFLCRNAASDRWQKRDWAALGLVVLAIALAAIHRDG